MKKHRALHWALAALCAAMFSPPQDGRADPDEENPQAATLDPDYAAGKKAIEARDWGRAIESQVQRADARNPLGIRGSGLDFALWIAELKVPDTFAERFKDQIEALLSRRARPAKAGRPKAKAESKAEIPV